MEYRKHTYDETNSLKKYYKYKLKRWIHDIAEAASAVTFIQSIANTAMKMQNLTFFTVLAFIITLGGVNAVCPAAYIDLGTGCYHFTVQENINWDQAYFICQLENNGYLVEIESQQEQTNLIAYIKAVIDPGLANNWWTGGTDVLAEGTFRWMTSGNELTYTAWEVNEPNDANSNEDCIGISTRNIYLWLDYKCNSGTDIDKTFKAICETNPIE